LIFDRITEVAKTGHFGDGLVWITEVEKVAFVFKTTQGAE
jgi:nitrogen regulatory protein P-II 1